MTGLTTRLRLLRKAFATDREGRAEYRRLERDLVGHGSPVEHPDIDAIIDRYSADEARTVRKILQRRAA